MILCEAKRRQIAQYWCGLFAVVREKLIKIKRRCYKVLFYRYFLKSGAHIAIYMAKGEGIEKQWLRQFASLPSLPTSLRHSSGKPSELACSTWSPSGDFFLCLDFMKRKNYQGYFTYNDVLQDVWKRCSNTIYCIATPDVWYRNPKRREHALYREDDPDE